VPTTIASTRWDERVSVFGRQQNRCGYSMAGLVSRFGDDPDFLAERSPVRRQDARAFNEGMVVGLTVLIVEVAPIASDMPLKELDGRLTGFLEGFEGTGGDEQFAEKELGLRFGDHRRSNYGVAFSAILTAVTRSRPIPTKRMAFRRAKPRAEKRVTFRGVLKRHLSVV